MNQHKQKFHYTIESAISLDKLEDDVNESLSAGYKLAGNLVIVERKLESGETVWDYFQPMLLTYFE